MKKITRPTWVVDPHHSKEPPQLQGTEPHTQDEREAAAAAWSITGSSKPAMRVLREWGFKIPDRTIRTWATKDWWEPMLEKARKRYRSTLDAKMEGTIQTLMEGIADRINKGEHKLVMVRRKERDDEGKYVHIVDYELKREPPALRDLTKGLDIVLHRQALIRGEPTSRSEKVDVKQRIADVRQATQAIGAAAREERDAEKTPAEGEVPDQEIETGHTSESAGHITRGSKTLH